VKTAAPPTASAAPPAASAEAPPKKKKRRPTRAEPTAEQMASYRKHLTEGRRLAGASKWAEAVTELSAALAAVPDDAPALTELGWAAFNAGDLDKAKQSNEKALKNTSSPRIKAMALYNLGRVAEAQKDPAKARAFYEKSLALRPNEAVDKRLSELTKKEKLPPSTAAKAEALPCATPAAKIEDVCACLQKPEEDDTGPRTCAEAPDVKSPRDDLRVLRVEAPPFYDFYWLVARGEKGWAPVADLGSTYNPGAFGIFEELTVETFEERAVGPSKVVWIETRKDRHDSDMGIDEYEEERTRTVVVCMPPAGSRKAFSCPLTVPVEVTSKRDRLGNPDFQPDAETRKLMTKGLPVEQAVRLEVALQPDARHAVVRVVSGTPSPALKALVGTHALE
jgi:hypothetical protein